jgi:ribosomal protein S6--L-glutamate ligase
VKIGILSRSATLYSTNRLVSAATARGCSVEVINPLQCYINISETEPTVHYGNRVLNEFEAIIPRIGVSVTFYATAVLRQFEMMGVYSPNSALAISSSRDKLQALQLLMKRGIGMPITGFAHSTNRTQDLIEMVGGTPLVIKTLQGTQGKGVALCESRKAAESMIETLRTLDAHFLVQEFISEANASDIRCIVVGNQVVAAMQRTGREGEFRSNLHKGGTAVAVDITEAERQIAIAAAQTLNISVGGVDILRSNTGPKLLEVNSSPGLEGIEGATGVDVAGCIIDYVMQQITSRRS